MSKGIAISAYGESARVVALELVESIYRVNRQFKLGLGIAVATDDSRSFRRYDIETNNGFPSEFGRWAKLNANKWTPFKNTLYLDADTRVDTDISPIFDLLGLGFDFVGTLSERQGDEWLWHIGDTERIDTERDIGYRSIAFQGGVWAFRKTNNSSRFFSQWRKRWKQYPDSEKEQGAMNYAMNESPMKTAILSSAFNGGTVIKHKFGSIYRLKGII